MPSEEATKLRLIKSNLRATLSRARIDEHGFREKRPFCP